MAMWFGHSVPEGALYVLEVARQCGGLQGILCDPVNGFTVYFCKCRFQDQRYVLTPEPPDREVISILARSPRESGRPMRQWLEDQPNCMRLSPDEPPERSRIPGFSAN